MLPLLKLFEGFYKNAKNYEKPKKKKRYCNKICRPQK